MQAVSHPLNSLNLRFVVISTAKCEILLSYVPCRQEEKKRATKREIKDAKVQELQEKLEARKAGE